MKVQIVKSKFVSRQPYFCRISLEVLRKIVKEGRTYDISKFSILSKFRWKLPYQNVLQMKKNIFFVMVELQAALVMMAWFTMILMNNFLTASTDGFIFHWTHFLVLLMFKFWCQFSILRMLKFRRWVRGRRIWVWRCDSRAPSFRPRISFRRHERTKTENPNYQNTQSTPKSKSETENNCFFDEQKQKRWEFMWKYILWLSCICILYFFKPNRILNDNNHIF